MGCVTSAGALLFTFGGTSALDDASEEESSVVSWGSAGAEVTVRAGATGTTSADSADSADK